jgi:hypothetical protein
MQHFIPDLKASVSTEGRAFFSHADNNDFIHSESAEKEACLGGK